MSMSLYIPDKKKKHTTQIFSSSPLKVKKQIVIKYLFLIKPFSKIKCVVDEYLCFPHARTKTSMSSVNMFWGRLFNDTVYVKFPVCFTIANLITKTRYFRYVMHQMHLFMLCAIQNAFSSAPTVRID